MRPDDAPKEKRPGPDISELRGVGWIELCADRQRWRSARVGLFGGELQGNRLQAAFDLNLDPGRLADGVLHRNEVLDTAPGTQVTGKGVALVLRCFFPLRHIGLGGLGLLHLDDRHLMLGDQGPIGRTVRAELEIALRVCLPSRGPTTTDRREDDRGPFHWFAIEGDRAADFGDGRVTAASDQAKGHYAPGHTTKVSFHCQISFHEGSIQFQEELRTRNRLAVISLAEQLVNGVIDRFRKECDRAIPKQKLCPAGMPAAKSELVVVVAGGETSIAPGRGIRRVAGIGVDRDQGVK